MQTLVFNSQKGGSGKTTLCASLAAYVETIGQGPAFLIDTDPQGTLTAWHSKRASEAPQRVELPFEGIGEALKLMAARGAAYCFIDTPPTRPDSADSDLAALASLFRLADLVLVPVRPSPTDLWAVAATVAALKHEAVPFMFVLNQVKSNASITGQAAAVLSHHGRVAETFIGDRVPYAAAMTDGRTASEIAPKGAAAAETGKLWKNIQACLHAGMPVTASKELVANG
jgi:chromosome partitioning protein